VFRPQAIAGRQSSSEDGRVTISPKDEVAKLAKVVHPWLLRLSGWRVGGRLGGMPVIVLTTTGRRTRQPRTTPLTVVEHEGRTYVVASYGGNDRAPAWFLNLATTPEVSVERRGRTEAAVARILEADERSEVWPVVTRTYRGYAGYQARTDRVIPVVELVPASSPDS